MILKVICPYCQYDSGGENKHQLILSDNKNARASLYNFQCGECEKTFPAFILDKKGKVEEMNLRNEDGSVYEFPDYSECSWYLPKWYLSKDKRS